MPDWKNTLWTNPHLSISSVSTWITYLKETLLDSIVLSIFKKFNYEASFA